MKFDEMIERRQEFNKKVSDLLKKDNNLKVLLDAIDQDFEEFFETLDDLIEGHPQQRFGQIVCNYIFWNYREDDMPEMARKTFEYIFPINFDPFYEESYETWERLNAFYTGSKS